MKLVELTILLFLIGPPLATLAVQPFRVASNC